MAENEQEDDAQKTDDPSAHKKQQSREKGQIPQSKEVYHFLALSTLLGFLWFQGEGITKSFFSLLKPWIETAGQRPFGGPEMILEIGTLVSKGFHICVFFFIVLFMAAVFALALQTQLVIAWDRLQPKLERISLIKGAQRLFSLRSLVEFFKSILKFAVILGLIILAIYQEWERLDSLSGIGVGYIFQESHDLVSYFLLIVSIGVFFIAIIDYGYQWFQNFQDMKMSKKELKDEFKNLEGDPLTAKRQRQAHQALLQAPSLIQTVTDATVVVTNPFHFAVVLKWVPHEMPVPVVMEKGADEKALQIRKIARRHFVPIVENRPLARLLFNSLSVGQEIKPEHYKAVAEIMRYIVKIDANQK